MVAMANPLTEARKRQLARLNGAKPPSPRARAMATRGIGSLSKISVFR
jgi:hypothetical protein